MFHPLPARSPEICIFLRRVITGNQGPHFMESTSPPKPRFWTTIRDYMRPYHLKLFFAMICAVITGIAVALQPIVVKFIVDRGVNRTGAPAEEKFKYVLLYTGLYLLLSGTRITVWLVGYRRLVAALEGFLFTIRSQFFRPVQSLCFRFHDNVSSGELFNYIMGSPVNSLKMFLQQFIMTVPTHLVSWVVALGALIYFDWIMAAILIATVTAIVCINRRSRRVIKAMSSEFMKQESSVSKYVADMLRGTREIKIHAIEDDVSDRFDFQIDRIREQSENLSYRQHVEYVKPESLHYAGMALIYIAGAYSCIYRELTVGEFFAFVSSINLLMAPMMMLFRLNLVKANAEAGLERILRILDTETTVAEESETNRVNIHNEDEAAYSEGIPLIEFKDVTFGYTAVPVLKQISCTIERNRSIALVGPSGSGKTTFAGLILRLYNIDSGRLLINGKDIKRYSLQELRSSFGVVSQEPFLFQTTIFENIRVANPGAGRKEVYDAMEMAYITEFINELPDGAETQVGENGYSLSGGQKQRIAIARAILGNHRYFIFDEATSALDNQSEKRIQQAMQDLMKNHTMIIIAHRLSTIRHVDKILVFQSGEIIQEGTYAYLSDTPGLFQTLLQNGL
ncbi:MAG: ATP-binding cassette domain-containing protein [Chitinivibrionales bacterium]|nr:ATP-binding cassette domain-containing protein [Chitinivibrionales bacterium]